MPYTSIKVGKKLRRVGLLAAQTRSTSDFEVKQHTESLQRLDEEERRSMARIQNELYKAKHVRNTSLSQPVSLLDVNTTIEQMVNKIQHDDKCVETVSQQNMFLPGMTYHNNGSIRTGACKLKSLSNAHKQLLRKLRDSQSAYYKVLQNKKTVRERESSNSRMKVVTSHVRAKAVKGETNIRRVRQRSLVREEMEGKSHACRGVTGNDVFVPDCKPCTKLMNKIMQSLAQSQAAAIGSSVLTYGENTAKHSSAPATPPPDIWLAAPHGKWYSREQSVIDTRQNIENLLPNSSKTTRDKAHIQHKTALNRLLLENPSMARKLGYAQISASSSYNYRESRRSLDIQATTSLSSRQRPDSRQASGSKQKGSIWELNKNSRSQPGKLSTNGDSEKKMNKLKPLDKPTQFGKVSDKNPGQKRTRVSFDKETVSVDRIPPSPPPDQLKTSRRKLRSTRSSQTSSVHLQRQQQRPWQIINEMMQREKEKEAAIKAKIDTFIQDINQFVASNKQSSE